MNNEDMTRFYDIGVDLGRPGDFVRRDKDGKIPGGLTLNKYEYVGRQRSMINKILNGAKSIVSMSTVLQPLMSITPTLIYPQFYLSAVWRDSNDANILYVGATSVQSGNVGDMTADDWKIKKINNDGTIANYTWKPTNYSIVYYNDTEIT